MKAKICVLAAALVVCAVVLPAAVPSAIAIKNARVVTVSGAALSKATVVLRDGLIEAVGADAAIPPDAWVIAMAPA